MKKLALNTLFSLLTVYSAHAMILLEIDVGIGSTSSIQFRPVVGAVSSNVSSLGIELDSDSFFGNLDGQVALRDFSTVSFDFSWANAPLGDSMLLGTATAPSTDAFTNGVGSTSGTFLLFGDVDLGGVVGSLAANQVNPFGTTPWSSSSVASFSQSNYDQLSSSGDIVVVTDSSTGATAVIGQWQLVPEPSSAGFLLGACAIFFSVFRRRLS